MVLGALIAREGRRWTTSSVWRDRWWVGTAVIALAVAPAEAQPTDARATEPAALAPAEEPAAAPSAEPSPDEAAGIVLLDQGHYREAVQAFERAMATDGESARVQTLVGTAHLAAGAPTRALRAFQRAALLEPGVAAHHLRVGQAYRASGALAAAARSYREALKLDPENAEALRAIGTLPGNGAPPPADEADARAPHVRSYRAVLGVTYLGAPLLGIGLTVATQSLVGFVFLPAPAIVHLAYGNGTAAAIALVGMVGFTAAGAGVGYELGCGGGGEFCGLWAIPGAGVGYLAWAIIDVAAFGEVEVEKSSERAVAGSALHLALIPTRDGLGAVLAGTL